jgi:hypothetical protein
MKSLTRAATAIGLAGLALAMVLGGIVGLRLGASASEPGVQQLSIIDPALAAAAPEHAQRSPAGFTGFGSAALLGEVIAGGVLESVEADENGNGGTLVFRDEGRRTSVRYLDGTRLFELVAGAELAAGDIVVLRFADDAVVGLLRVPADAEAGSTGG